MNVCQYSQWRVLVDWVDCGLGKRILHGDLSLLLCKLYRVPKIAGTIAPFIETQFEVSLGWNVFDVVRVFLNSLNGSSWFKLKVTFEMKPGVGAGGLNKVLYMETPRCKPLPFYIPFLIEKIPLSYYCIIVPLSHTYRVTFTERFTWQTLKILGWISRRLGVSIWDLWKSFLIPKWQFSQPFFRPVLQSLPFYIPLAWKG